MTLGLKDGRNLERIAAALERMAAADERRNDLLEADASQRRAAWRESQETAERHFAEILGSPAGASDPWRDLPENQR